jgi:hypothetical protein
MKKFVFISLILALAASVAFAQDEGSWSVSGSGEVSTLMNFTFKDANGHLDAQVGAHGYNRYGYYGATTGTLGITYSRGDLSVGLSFDPTDDTYADLSYNSDNAAFQTNVSLTDILDKTFAPGRLWGYYKFLDGKIHLEGAFASRDTNYWNSNEAVGNIFDSANLFIVDDTKLAENGTDPAYGNNKYKFGIGWGFASVDHHDYLLANFSPIEGLEVGLMIPGFYANPGNHDNGVKGTAIEGGYWGSNSYAPAVTVPNYTIEMVPGFSYTSVREAFKKTVFGAKYATGPVEVALQFALNGTSGTSAKDKKQLNSKLYLGGKYNISDGINAGLAMEATFDNKEDSKKDGSTGNQFGIALSFGYGAGALNAGLEGGLLFRNNFKNTDKAKGPIKDKGVLGLKPQISYNIIENYLCLSLETLLFFELDSDVSDVMGLGYEITPELWFNVSGTGAGKGYYYPNATAIILRYKVGGFTKEGKDIAADPTVNALDLTFKWSF